MSEAASPYAVSFRAYVLSRRFSSGRGWKSGWPFVVWALGHDEILTATSWPELREGMVRLGRDDLRKGAHDVWRRYIQSRREPHRVEVHRDDYQAGAAPEQPTCC